MATARTSALYGQALYGQTLFNGITVSASAALPIEALGYSATPGADIVFYVTINRAGLVATVTPIGPGT